MSELKPCPFCGGQGNLCADYGRYQISCNNTDCKMNPVTEEFYSAGEAIAVWNSRATPIKPAKDVYR